MIFKKKSVHWVQGDTRYIHIYNLELNNDFRPLQVNYTRKNEHLSAAAVKGTCNYIASRSELLEEAEIRAKHLVLFFYRKLYSLLMH